MIVDTFSIRYSAVKENFTDDHNTLRYKEELKKLRTDIGRSAEENDFDLIYLFKIISQELGFISNGGKTIS